MGITVARDKEANLTLRFYFIVSCFYL